MNRSGRTLLLLVGLLVSPFVVASALYWSGWQPGGAPRGQLLQPPRPLPATFPALADGRWLLVVAGAGPCAEQCEQLLDESRRIQVALYKQMPRLSRLWLGDVAIATEARLHQRQPDLATMPASTSMPEVRQAFELNVGHRPYLIYLMDPQGRLVLRYQADAPPGDILKDLQRLLRYG